MSNSSAPAPKRPRPQRRRDTVISILVASAIMVFLVFGVLEMSKGLRGTTGVIMEKKFVTAPESQVSVGTSGLQKRDIAGEFFLIVKTPSDEKMYNIRVPQTVYDEQEVGAEYYFVRPQASPEPK